MTTTRAFTGLEHGLGNAWKIKADANYALNERQRFSADIWLNPQLVNPVTGATTLKQSDNPSRSENTSVDVYATGPFDLLGRRHEATLGANINSYRYWVGVNTSLSAPGNLNDFVTGNISNLAAVPMPNLNKQAAQGGSNTTESSIYGSVRFRPMDPLSVIVGGRFSYYKNTDWSRFWFNGTNGALVNSIPVKENGVFTPYVGATYDLSEQFSVYANYTEVFTPNSVKGTSNSTLDPRTGNNKEIGIKGELLGGRLNTSAALFRIEEDNVPVLISNAAPLPDGTLPYRAEKGAKSQGYELTASGALTPGWQVMGGYTYAHKQSNTGALLNTHYPTRLMKLATSVRNIAGIQGLTAGGNFSYQSSIYWDELYGRGRVTQGGLTTVGLFAAYEFTPRTSVSFNVENLTDKTVYSFGGNGYSVNVPPRNAWLKLHYKL